MKVSVIIPIYNEEKVILNCLKSLSKQTLADFEIIFVDDGSTDSTLSILQGQTLQGKKLIIFKQSHKGAGAARNLGASQARGDILVFVDADMTLDKGFLKKLIEPITKGKIIGTFSKEEYLENKDNPLAVAWNLNRRLPKDRMHPSNYPDQQKVYRAILTKEFDKVGGFDEKAGYTDDYSLFDKLNVMAINAPGAIFYHKNPDTYREVFAQSKWMAKRKYKLGILGTFIALVRVSLPASLVLGILLALSYSLPAFLPFKIISDMGSFLGIMEYSLQAKVSK